MPQFGLIEHPTYVKQRIKEIARSIRSQASQEQRLRFDPYHCAFSLGLNITEANLPKGMSGRLRLDSEKPEIVLQRTDSRVRKRYTVCHEMAHLSFIESTPSLPRERGEIELIPEVERREERLCDMIAAELLMPESVFIKQAASIPASYDSLILLAKDFEVSIAAALIRIRNMHLWSVGVMHCQFDEKESIVRRLFTWVSICRKVRSREQRMRLSYEFEGALEASRKFIQKNPLSITTGKRLKFNDFVIHLLSSNSNRKIKAVAFRQL